MKKNYLILIILIQLNSYLTYGQISIMTFNIRYDNPKDNENWWEYRKSSVVQMFKFYSLDNSFILIPINMKENWHIFFHKRYNSS